MTVPSRAEDIPGWMTSTELQWLNAMAQRMSSVIEIGSWKGRSTFALLSGCIGPVYAIDHWQGSPDELGTSHQEAQIHGPDALCQEFLGNVGHFGNLHVITRPSLEAASYVPDCDMVFVDADHSYEAVKADILCWRSRARKLLCGHDYEPGWPSVQQAVDDTLGPTNQGPGSIWYLWIGPRDKKIRFVTA